MQKKNIPNNSETKNINEDNPDNKVEEKTSSEKTSLDKPKLN